MSQSDSHRCRASISSWMAFTSCLLVMGVVNDGVVGKEFYSRVVLNIIREVVNVD